MNFKERFDVYLKIGLEREFTEEECVALGALAQESLVVKAAKVPTPPAVLHPLTDFWMALAGGAGPGRVANKNLKATHHHVMKPILEAVNVAGKSEG